jgi:hypothetical protein
MEAWDTKTECAGPSSAVKVHACNTRKHEGVGPSVRARRGAELDERLDLRQSGYRHEGLCNTPNHGAEAPGSAPW